MVNFNQEIEELIGDFASPIWQAKAALELNSVRAGCLVTPLVQDGKQITELNLSVAVDVGAAGHLGGGDDNPLAAIWNCIAYEALDACCFNCAV